MPSTSFWRALITSRTSARVLVMGSFPSLTRQTQAVHQGFVIGAQMAGGFRRGARARRGLLWPGFGHAFGLLLRRRGLRQVEGVVLAEQADQAGDDGADGGAALAGQARPALELG